MSKERRHCLKNQLSKNYFPTQGQYAWVSLYANSFQRSRQPFVSTLINNGELATSLHLLQSVLECSTLIALNEIELSAT